MGPRSRAGERLKEHAGAVVGAERMEHAFTGEALGRGVMHAELSGDLGGGQPPRLAEMLGETRNPVGDADVSDPKSGEELSGPYPQPPPIQRVGDLSIRVLGGQGAHHLDDGRRRPRAMLLSLRFGG
jgi:hypothetical protein